jgi:hypothetical protein
VCSGVVDVTAASLRHQAWAWCEGEPIRASDLEGKEEQLKRRQRSYSQQNDTTKRTRSPSHRSPKAIRQKSPVPALMDLQLKVLVLARHVFPATGQSMEIKTTYLGRGSTISKTTKQKIDRSSLVDNIEKQLQRIDK